MTRHKIKPQPLSVAVCAIMRRNQILLLKRTKDPYRGYWSLPAGKIKYGEPAREAALRETFEETGLAARFVNHLGVVSERLIKNDLLVGHFIMHLVKLATDIETVVESHEGQLRWFPVDEIGARKNRIIGSDKAMIEKMILQDGKAHYECLIEQDGAHHTLRIFE